MKVSETFVPLKKKRGEPTPSPDMLDVMSAKAVPLSNNSFI